MMQFKKRREEIALGINHDLRKNEIIKFGHLPSKSFLGKVSEHEICKKFSLAQKDA